jgi:hypothetical protein
MTPISSLTGEPFPPSPLVDHPASRLDFSGEPNAALREAFELIRETLVAAPNKQASYAAVPHFSSVYSLLKQAR